MGFLSFWSQLKSSRTKDNPPPPQPTSSNYQRRRSGTTSSVQHARQYTSQPPLVAESVLSHPPTPSSAKAKRRSRVFDLSRNKSESDLGLKKRRSWFGGKPADFDEIPAVPDLPAPGYPRSRPINAAIGSPTGPGTAVTTDAEVSWSKPQSPVDEESQHERMPVERTLSRKRSTATRSTMKKRQSGLGGKPVGREAPSPPAMPATSPAPAQLVDPQAGVTPSADKRRSLRKSLAKRLSIHRSKSAGDLNGEKTWSWSETNDPIGASQVPPVPALVHDGAVTPDSSVPNTSSPDNTEYLRDMASTSRPPAVRRVTDDEVPVHTVTRKGSIKQPRPLSLPASGNNSMKRRSYTPKNAAGGFLRTVSGASLTANKGVRKSMLDEPNARVVGMGCLGEEHQLEWDRLKHLLEEMEREQREQNNGVMGMLRELDDEEGEDDRQTYANAQALAALEFGVDGR